MFGGLGVVRRLLDVPLTGKSASSRPCVRAGEAKLRVRMREIMLLYAGLPILELFCFASSSSLIDCYVLYGFCVVFEIIVAIRMGLMSSCWFAWY